MTITELKPRLYIGMVGLFFGSVGALAVNWGNPPNMGMCVAGFVSDTAGALNLHDNSFMQYIRPEILGFTFGAFAISQLFREWKPRGGASPLIRFMLGFAIMIGALTFLGCPVRMLLRLAGGDLNGLTALFGLVGGVVLGVMFLRRGFTLGAARPVTPVAGLIWPVVMIGLLALAVFQPAFISFSQEGPGSQHMPLFLALGLGATIGALAQRVRMCSIGAWRDLFLVRNTYLFTGIAALFIGAILTNYIAGNFNTLYHWGFDNQPLAHADHFWNFAGMGLVGLAAVEVGACPFRNLVLVGEGDTDAGAMVAGLFAGAIVANNLNVIASPEGVGQWGPLAVGLGWAFCLGIGLFLRTKYKKIPNGRKV